MTRLDHLPRPSDLTLDEPWSADKVRMMSIRHRLSLVAARLTGKPERVAWALGEVRAVVEELEALVDVKEER